MTYRFKADESLGKAVERVALEQLDEALEHTRATTKLDDAIHDVRVCIKKLRGLTRLVREELGDDLYQREDTSYRDLNRQLSDVRDSAALTETVTKLKERFTEELSDDAFEGFRRSLTQGGRGRQADKRKALVDVRKKIIAAHKRVERWKIESDGFSAVGKGLTRSYSAGRKGFDRAYARQTVRAFHEWRKDAKYLWYHIELLRELWPGQLKKFSKQIKRLVGYLSDDHDLALLRKRALAESEQEQDGHEYEALLALIDKRRAELQTQACFLGQRLYAESAAAYRSRFKEYWRAWRAEDKTNPIAAT
ncbi:MAG TPA: CHAD domain-containing protein [Pyrinomonadaceae bacterium]|nr:CHAD domain-containing protein [Pyrinomonadaceae bacterium]